MVRCPLCGSPIELGYIADLMGIADAPDECPKCGVQIRIKVEWRQAVGA
jgi:rRNA maturation endonuclease Nob1